MWRRVGRSPTKTDEVSPVSPVSLSTSDSGSGLDCCVEHDFKQKKWKKGQKTENMHHHASIETVEEEKKPSPRKTNHKTSPIRRRNDPRVGPSHPFRALPARPFRPSQGLPEWKEGPDQTRWMKEMVHHVGYSAANDHGIVGRKKAGCC